MKYYVYEHYRPDTDECFYVGKGSGTRATNMSLRSRLHKVVQAELRRKELQVEVRIYRHSLEEAEAFRVEIERIAFWRERVLLVNFSIGGEGAAGVKRSAETRAKLRASKIGKKRAPFTAEARANMSRAHKGRKRTPEAVAKTAAAHRGRKRSPDTSKRLSEAVKQAWARKKNRAQSPEHVARRVASRRAHLAVC